MTIDDVMKAAQHAADAQEGYNSDGNAMEALRSTVQAAIALAVDVERQRCEKIGNCKDCKYWEAHIDMRNKQWNSCEAARWVDFDEQIGDTDLAVYADAIDDSGLQCGIKTGPMFGCVKYQQRPTKENT